MLYVELGGPQAYSFFLPWKLAQKLGQSAAALREVCRRALLVQNLPVAFLCCPTFKTRFVRLPRSGGRVSVSASVSEGLDLGRPGFFPELVVGLDCFVEGCTPCPGVPRSRKGARLSLLLS